MTTAVRLRWSLQQPDGRHRAVLTRGRVRRWLHGPLAAVGFAGRAQFVVRIVDADEGRGLNRDFRGRDYATDVLTFPYTPPCIDGWGRLRPMAAPSDEPPAASASASTASASAPDADDDVAPDLHADLVLCAPVVERQAGTLGLPLADHYAHLLVHGVLHALGHDHERAAPARRMEALERRILAGWGISDPYAGGDSPVRAD